MILPDELVQDAIDILEFLEIGDDPEEKWIDIIELLSKIRKLYFGDKK